MKFTKRIATTALAGAMAMSLAVPAFAANETKITAKYAEVKIDVVVPTTGTATINPYKLDVELTKSDDTTATLSGQQIVTQPLALINKTKMTLDVDASVLATETGTFKFSATAPTDTSNSGYVFLEAKASTLDKDDMEDGALKQDALIDEFAAWTANDTVTDPDITPVLKAGTTPVKTGGSAGTKHLVQLAAGQANATDATQVDIQSGGIALFRLSGKVVKDPAIAWKTTDGFTATIAFTFVPGTAAGGGAGG